MSPTQGGRLSDVDRLTLQVMMDRLLPAVDELPGAGEMGLASEVEQRARRHRPLRSALIAVMDGLSMDMAAHAAGGFKALSEEQQIESLLLLEEAMPEHFARLVALIYTTYYMQPEVDERIGWPGGAVQPEGFDVEPFDESILETARQRDPLWRHV